MTDPQDQGFELSGVLFGQDGDVLVEDFQPGSFDWRTQDAVAGNGDYQSMGRDFRTPGTWTWSLGINRDDENGALETLEALNEAWNQDDLPRTPNAVVPLRYRINGRTRRVYGRPRRFVPTLDIRRLSGYIGVDCDFARADVLHYDDEEQSVALGMQPGSTGGFTTPFTFPLTSIDDAASAGRVGQIIVGGNAPTPVTIEISGDVARPWVELSGLWRLQLETVIPPGGSILVDSNVWSKSAVRGTGGSIAGAIRGTSISELLLPPGSHELTFGGTSSTGGATATVRWRAASKSL